MYQAHEEVPCIKVDCEEETAIRPDPLYDCDLRTWEIVQTIIRT